MSFVVDDQLDNTFPKMVIDTAQLQDMQDAYSEVTNLFIFCVNESGKRITEMSGNPNEIVRVVSLLDESRIKTVISRVLGHSVEEQVIEDTAYPNVKIASVGVRINGDPSFCWFICGIMPDDGEEGNVLNITSTIEYDRFVKAVDFIREMSKRVYGAAFTTANAVAQTKRATDESARMEHALKRSESMTGIVQLLDSDESISRVADSLLDYCGHYTGISHAYILRPNLNGKTIDVIGRFIRSDMAPLDAVIGNIPIDMLKSLAGKTSVISYKTRIDASTREWMDNIGISAAVIIPITVSSRSGDSQGMTAFFLDSVMNREWDMEELKFFGDAIKILGSIMTRRIQNNSITGSYKSLEMILNNVGCAIYVRDSQTGELLFANRVVRNTFTDELEEGKLADIFEASPRYNTNSSYNEVYYPVRKRWYDVNSTYIQWVDGRRVALYAIIDVTEKKEYQRKIEQQANNDFLTGLYNRMCCERDLVRFVDEAKAAGGKGAVLYLDLDDFKHINDGLGHQYGDVLLKAISTNLTKINGVENTCYRMGGDEFVIIIPHTSYHRFEDIIEDIRVVFNKPWFLKGGDYYCTSSMGIVTFPDEGDTVEDLIKKADVAMYEAKKSGKNKLAHYEEDSGSLSNKRLDMEKSMRDATAKDYDQFEVYYQPIVDVSKPGAPCCGAEALIRWNSEDLGFVSPADFIPLAEYLGLINPIGHHVLRQACKALKHWNESGHPYYKVNVNLSVVQLMQTDVAASIEEVIMETGINPKNLTLEVTESLAINDMGRMKKILADIKRLGVNIALDDFGTGYSSLNHIREIPLDVIKVDQSFVTDLAIDQYAQSFIRMIGELANALGVRICVEGIETIEQYKVLEGMNVRLVQGFYFDRPMPKDQFEAKYL